MTAQVTQQVNATVFRGKGATAQPEPCLDLTAERFMGTLFHPVSRGQMLRKFGMDRRGCKVVARWCREADEEHPVRVGDLLEIEGARRAILGVEERPGCYLELYVEEV